MLHSATQCARQDSLRQPSLEDEEDYDGRQRRQHDTREQWPVWRGLFIARCKQRERYRRRPYLILLQNEQAEQEIVPDRDELQDPDDDQSWPHERQNDSPVKAEHAAAIDRGCVQQFIRNSGADILAHQEDVERRG